MIELDRKYLEKRAFSNIYAAFFTVLLMAAIYMLFRIWNFSSWPVRALLIFNVAVTAELFLGYMDIRHQLDNGNYVLRIDTVKEIKENRVFFEKSYLNRHGGLLFGPETLGEISVGDRVIMCSLKRHDFPFLVMKYRNVKIDDSLKQCIVD